MQSFCEFLGALCDVKYQSYDYINMTGSTYKILNNIDIQNWNIKFHMGKSIMTCRAKSRIGAKRWSCKCKLLYHKMYGNLCRCRNLGFLKILTLSVSLLSAEEKERLVEKICFSLSSHRYRKFFFLPARIWIYYPCEKWEKWIRFWKLKSLVYYVLLKLWEQSSYLKQKCHVIYEVNGR